MSNQARLVIAAELENLAQVCRFVEDTAQALGIAPRALFSLRLAVEEAVANSIIHGYHGSPGEIEIMLEQAGDAVIIHLRDQAPPFDPTSVPPPDLRIPLHLQTVGGRGVHLIRQNMDQVTWQLTATGGNELILVKRIAAPV